LGTMSPLKTTLLVIGTVLFVLAIYVSTSLTRWQRAVFDPAVSPKIHCNPSSFLYVICLVVVTKLSEGEPFTLHYKPTKSVPPPVFSWSITDDRFGKSQTAVVTDKRVQIDQDGE